jgi:hypothetical protein
VAPVKPAHARWYRESGIILPQVIVNPNAIIEMLERELGLVGYVECKLSSDDSYECRYPASRNK